ncbi:MAG TPA: imidazole glycerol phosphate synthase subunit HisH [Dongiaceae bacterium]|nr:imidazole glycerol phosphate synthase subunit HisH [Dongiaceae bacterium]
MIVTVIDYGAGNVTSVARAFRKLGSDVHPTANPNEIEHAACLVLPGVGHCAALLHALDHYSLREPIQSSLSRGTPFLGICLGLQALYSKSAEAPDLPGLDVFHSNVEHLPENVKLPHMGWNQIHYARTSALLHEISSGAHFYFAHSYAAPATGSEAVAYCEHGRSFAAVIECGRIFGVQFHPEKSGATGAKLLANFLRLAA